MGLKNPSRWQYLRGLVGYLVVALIAGAAFGQQPTIRFVRNPDPAPEFKLSTLE